MIAARVNQDPDDIVNVLGCLVDAGLVYRWEEAGLVRYTVDWPRMASRGKN